MAGMSGVRWRLGVAWRQGIPGGEQDFPHDLEPLEFHLRPRLVAADSLQPCVEFVAAEPGGAFGNFLAEVLEVLEHGAG